MNRIYPKKFVNLAKNKVDELMWNPCQVKYVKHVIIVIRKLEKISTQMLCNNLDEGVGKEKKRGERRMRKKDWSKNCNFFH